MDLKEELQNAIKQSNSVNAKKILSETPFEEADLNNFLLLSARYRRGEMVEQLVILGAQVDKLDHVGMSPLHYCAAKNLSRAASVLIYSDAQIDLPDPGGRTPLMLSVNFGHNDTFNILVQETKNINATDKNGNSALKIAVDKGLVDFARILIEKNATLDSPDTFGRTALISATAQGDGELFSILLKAGADFHARDKKGRDSLLIAGALGRIDIVEQLIQAGADIHSKDNDGNTILQFISSEFQTDISKYIQGSGEDLYDNSKITVENGSGLGEPNTERMEITSLTHTFDLELSDAENKLLPNAPLNLPNPSARRDLANILIKNGIYDGKEVQPAVESPKHSNGKPPFQRENRLAPLQKLIKKAYRALMSSMPSRGYAAHPGTTSTPPIGPRSIIPLETSNNADSDSKFPSQPRPSSPIDSHIGSTETHSHSTPSFHSSASGSSEAGATPGIFKNQDKNQERTQDRNAAGQTPFLLACANNDFKELFSWITSGIDLNQKDFQGRTGLILAAAGGHSSVVNYLISKKVKIDLKDSQNSNALMLAIANQHFDVVKSLVEAGAEVNARFKGTPFLMLAISKGNVAITNYLLGKGAQIQEKDYRGATAFEYAVASKSEEMMNLVKAKMKSKSR